MNTPRPRFREFGHSANKVIYLLGAALCLTPWASPPVALGLGAAMALTLGGGFGKAGNRISRKLLQACVVLLGFGMNLPQVLRVGTDGALVAAFTIAVTLSAGWLIGRWLKLPRGAVVLLSAGTAICGGSAIAAVGSALDSEQRDMTVAMGTVFLLNAVALYLFPMTGHLAHLTQQQFGLWAGIGIHDVSSVVGAAGQYGQQALETATAVKLSRALWIVPLTLGISFALRRQGKAVGGKVTNASFGFDPTEAGGAHKIQIPWFIALFLLASILRGLIPGIAPLAVHLTDMARIGLTLTLFLIGTSLTRQTLAAVGWRALVHGVALWVLVGGLSLLIVKIH